MDLLKKLLKAKPEDRISAKDSLKHPWISVIYIENLKNLKYFVRKMEITES